MSTSPRALGLLCILLAGVIASWPIYGQSVQRIQLKVIKQINDYSCGIACVTTVLDYWDVNTQQQQILHRYPPQDTAQGYSLGQLKRIVQDHNLEGYALFSNLSFLRAQIRKERPVIVALVVPYNMYSLDWVRNVPVYGEIFEYLTQASTFSHFVVVHDVDREKVRVMDPLYGLKSLSKEAFETMWDKKHNAMLLVAA